MTYTQSEQSTTASGIAPILGSCDSEAVLQRYADQTIYRRFSPSPDARASFPSGDTDFTAGDVGFTLARETDAQLFTDLQALADKCGTVDPDMRTSRRINGPKVGDATIWLQVSVQVNDLHTVDTIAVVHSGHWVYQVDGENVSQIDVAKYAKAALG